MKKGALILIILFSAFTAFSQITVKYLDGKKESYHRGDVIKMTVVVKLNPKSCLEGADKTYIYCAGCQNQSKSSWKEISKNVYSKDLIIKISDKAKNKSTVTFVRNTDKESFTQQEIFKISN